MRAYMLMGEEPCWGELAIAPPDIAGANESCAAEPRPLIGGVIIDSWADTWSREDDAQNHNLCRPTTPLAHAACHVHLPELSLGLSGANAPPDDARIELSPSLLVGIAGIPIVLAAGGGVMGVGDRVGILVDLV